MSFVLFEDENLLILNKPSGIPSVPHAPDEARTAVQLALDHCPALKGVGRKSLEPGLLHRLDTGTSGVLAFAKSNNEFERLKEIWKKSPPVKKTYRALINTSEAYPETPLKIENLVGHDPKSAKKMTIVKEGRKIRGKPMRAVTHLRRLVKVSDSLSDLEIEITTGVMHQIRLHLSSLGFPILGDTLYRGKESDRLWLHAWKLSLPLKSGAELVVEAQLPKNWIRGF